MNKVVLIGRLTRDPELRYTNQGIALARFTLAVNRRRQKDKPEEADFVSCVAWRNTAENLAKYQGKGSQIAVYGRIQTGSYDNKEGKKVYTTEVVADEIEFLGSKKDSPSSNGNNEFNQDFGVPLDDFHSLEDDDLPF